MSSFNFVDFPECKYDPTQEFWFSRDLFSFLLEYFSVPEAYAMFPRLSRWHTRFLGAQNANLRFLREWILRRHGLSLLVSHIYNKGEEAGESLQLLLETAFAALEESNECCQSAGFSLSNILRYFYDSSLSLPSEKNLEFRSLVSIIRTFQLDIQADLLSHCAKHVARITQELSIQNSDFDISRDPFVPLAIEIVGSPLLFDPHQQGAPTLKDKASYVVKRLIVLDPDKCDELCASEALLSAFYSSESVVTRNHCANALLHLLSALYKNERLAKALLSSEFFDKVSSDIEENGCDAFADTTRGFRKLCLSKGLKRPHINLTSMLHFCEVVLKDCKPGRMFYVMVDCLYLMVRDLARRNVDMFLDSGIFELISQQKINLDITEIYIDIRILLMVSLIMEYGDIRQCDCIKAIFPVIPLMRNILSQDRSDRVLKPFGYCLPILLNDRQIVNDFFEDKTLVRSLINRSTALVLSQTRDMKLIEKILICIRRMIILGKLEHIEVLINEGVWNLIGECTVVSVNELGAWILNIVCLLLDTIDRSGDWITCMDYTVAKDICDINGISQYICEYCKLKYLLGLFPVRVIEYPTLLQHFPKVKPYLFRDDEPY